MLSGDATNINYIVFGLTRAGSNPRYAALEASTLTITSATDAVQASLNLIRFFYIL